MADREVIWSPTAKRKLLAILEFFIERNKSNNYSLKLYNTFQKQLLIIQKSPDIGIKTDMKDIRGLIVLDYTLFYEVTDANIIVHTVWDNRQNPDDLKIKK
jgi:addiction module RelE/StbE family toxin